MSRKRIRKGDLFSKHLSFEKEMVPHIYNGGRNRRRRGFFKCVHHDDSYYEMTFDQARNTEKHEHCPCLHNTDIKQLRKEDINSYNYLKRVNEHKRAIRQTPAGWFKVTRTAIIVEGKVFYEFEKGDRTGLDYRTARDIENITWNRPKVRKAFYLARLSYEYDRLHREGLIVFKSELWNRGAGREVLESFV